MNVKDDLEDKIIAVTGVSKDESKCGFKVFKDLISKNLRVYGVNPNADVVLNRKIYKKNAHTKPQSHRVYFSFVSRCLRVRIIKRTFLYDKKISEIPEKPDIVVTVVPPKVTENIVDECKNLGINEIRMQPGSESEEAIKKAENFGMNVTYNMCIMLETEKS